MSIDKDDSHYEIVLAGDEVSQEQVPANGKIWTVGSVEGDAPSSSDGWIALIWDYGVTDEVLFVTYGSKKKKLDYEITGDGVKILALVLHNEGSTDLMMGGSYLAREE